MDKPGINKTTFEIILKEEYFMEQWEKDLREKLDKEIPHGAYQIGEDKFIAFTGKGGYIEFQVELYRLIRKDFDKKFKDNMDNLHSK